MRIQIDTADIGKYGYRKTYILGIIRENPIITTDDLMEITGLGYKTIPKHIYELISAKLLKPYKISEFGKTTGSGGKNKYVKFEVLGK